MTDLRAAAEDALKLLEHWAVRIEGEWGMARTLEELEKEGSLEEEILNLRAALEQEKKWDLIAEMHNVEEQDMTDKPEALFLADALEVALDTVISGEVDRRAAAELRRLHNVNEELVNALKFALNSYGKLLLSDPPQDAWKTYGVEAKARAAIAKAEDKP